MYHLHRPGLAGRSQRQQIREDVGPSSSRPSRLQELALEKGGHSGAEWGTPLFGCTRPRWLLRAFLAVKCQGETLRILSYRLEAGPHVESRVL